MFEKKAEKTKEQQTMLRKRWILQGRQDHEAIRVQISSCCGFTPDGPKRYSECSSGPLWMEGLL